MTNNYELARKLKKEITLANFKMVHPVLSITPDELSSLLAERDADKKRIEMLEEYVNERDAQNQNLLLNIGSLQQRIAELEARTVSVKLPDNCEHDVIAPVCSFMYESGFEIDSADYNALVARVRSEVETVMRRTFRAAGINLEVGE
ncbi:hypothetical protein BBB57_01160 [Kosakonia sacchari]|uniref:hypothetical protein n=1 Tax=Kosakonia sacchari TaxID=1158459 RepID=UPI0008074F77|nr:hypothetical protein [Kosakonia sacchari]ANR76986.1 hypothetical protein BBB57_01160 [Kosakonia sacchari]